jgi:hypothetical protein
MLKQSVLDLKTICFESQNNLFLKALFYGLRRDSIKRVERNEKEVRSIARIGKHVMNKWDVEGAFEKYLEKHPACKAVDSVDVPWWNPLEDSYDCTAKIERNDGSFIDISFTVEEYALASCTSASCRVFLSTCRCANGI